MFVILLQKYKKNFFRQIFMGLFLFIPYFLLILQRMKEFVISEAKAETAVLVGLITKDQDEAKTKEYLDELEFLAKGWGTESDYLCGFR